jgi:hypothetical protein
VAFVGTSEHANVADARVAAETEILYLADFLRPKEFLPVATLVFQTDTAYTNAINSRVISATAGGDSYLDFRKSTRQGIGGGGSISVEHNATTGKQASGGAVEFYHLTEAEHIVATQPATAAQDGYLDKDDWTVFNSKSDPTHTHTGVYEPVLTRHDITKSDDTNVTLSLTGTPIGSVLQPVSFVLGWTGTLADSRITSSSIWNAKESGLGNPATNGMILSSTTGGIRSWIHKQQDNSSVSQQSGFSSDTYLVGSSIAIPSSSLKAKSKYRLRFSVTKTAAGTAPLVVTVRIGTNGSTADTARLVFTAPTNQTAAIDTADFDLIVVFRTVGSGISAVIAGSLSATKNTTNQNQGHWNGPTLAIQGVSAGFDSTVANSIIGVSYNGGTGYSGTCELVEASLDNLL